MVSEREREPRPSEGDEVPGKSEVNPAARRDRPGHSEGDEEAGEHRPDESQVSPAQEEPLDPLAPGGIGG